MGEIHLAPRNEFMVETVETVVCWHLRWGIESEKSRVLNGDPKWISSIHRIKQQLSRVYHGQVGWPHPDEKSLRTCKDLTIGLGFCMGTMKPSFSWFHFPSAVSDFSHFFGVWTILVSNNKLVLFGQSTRDVRVRIIMSVLFDMKPWTVPARRGM